MDYQSFNYDLLKYTQNNLEYLIHMHYLVIQIVNSLLEMIL